MLKTIVRKLYYLRSTSKFRKIGKNIILSKGGVFIHPEEIIFGSNIFISRNFHISAKNLVMGSNIMIGPNLVIECSNHRFNKVGVSMFEYQKDKTEGFVTIENDVWIGANVVILSNVIIGEGCIVGAGSIVTKNLPPYFICVGSPCSPVRKRFTDDELKNHLAKISTSYTFEKVKSLCESYCNNK